MSLQITPVRFISKPWHCMKYKQSFSYASPIDAFENTPVEMNRKHAVLKNSLEQSLVCCIKGVGTPE